MTKRKVVPSSRHQVDDSPTDSDDGGGHQHRHAAAVRKGSGVVKVAAAAREKEAPPGRTKEPSKPWTLEEAQQLYRVVERLAPSLTDINWADVAKYIANRTGKQVRTLEGWLAALRHPPKKPKLLGRCYCRRRPAAAAGRARAPPVVAGARPWAARPHFARNATSPARRAPQCREKWKNDLRPGLTKEPWSLQEEFMLALAHSKFGNCWSEVAKFLPRRAENTIKNHW